MAPVQQWPTLLLLLVADKWVPPHFVTVTRIPYTKRKYSYGNLFWRFFFFLGLVPCWCWGYVVCAPSSSALAFVQQPEEGQGWWLLYDCVGLSTVLDTIARWRLERRQTNIREGGK